jgi:hypothetical protein
MHEYSRQNSPFIQFFPLWTNILVSTLFSSCYLSYSRTFSLALSFYAVFSCMHDYSHQHLLHLVLSLMHECFSQYSLFIIQFSLLCTNILISTLFNLGLSLMHECSRQRSLIILFSLLCTNIHVRALSSNIFRHIVPQEWETTFHMHIEQVWLQFCKYLISFFFVWDIEM